MLFSAVASALGALIVIAVALGAIVIAVALGAILIAVASTLGAMLISSGCTL